MSKTKKTAEPLNENTAGTGQRWSLARIGRAAFLVVVVGAGLLAAYYARDLSLTDLSSPQEQTKAMAQTDHTRVPAASTLPDPTEAGEILSRGINRQDDPYSTVPASITLLDESLNQVPGQAPTQASAETPTGPAAQPATQPAVVDVTDQLATTPASNQTGTQAATQASPTPPPAEIQAAQIAQATLKLAQQAEQQAQKQLRALRKALQPYGVQTLPDVMAHLPEGDAPVDLPTWWTDTLGYFMDVREARDTDKWISLLKKGDKQGLKQALAPYKNDPAWQTFTDRAQAYMALQRALMALVPAEEETE